jgi:hypothetical protein
MQSSLWLGKARVVCGSDLSLSLLLCSVGLALDLLGLALRLALKLLRLGLGLLGVHTDGLSGGVLGLNCELMLAFC